MTEAERIYKVPWWCHKRVVRRFIAGFIGIAATFGILFLVGKHSPAYDPDPMIEGKKLSQWADDLTRFGPDVDPARKALKILQAHRKEVTPALIQWLDERDSVPEIVYFFTMEFLEAGTGRDWIAYRGAHMNHWFAAKAFGILGDRDPKVIVALKRAQAYYAGSPITASADIQRALEQLDDLPVAVGKGEPEP